MKTKHSLLLVTGALSLSLTVGGILSAQADPESPSPPQFQTNDSGQTFGTVTKDGERPDFTRPPGAEFEGWLKTDDWMPPKQANGAPVHSARVYPDANGDIKIPAYAFDGKTVVGWVTIGHVNSE